MGRLGALLQGIRGEPAAGSVRPTVHRCRVLRPWTGPGDIAAVAADRAADRPAGDPTIAGALPADRAGRRAASDAARCDHRQPRPRVARTVSGPLPISRAAAGAAARLPAARPSRTSAA